MGILGGQKYVLGQLLTLGLLPNPHRKMMAFKMVFLGFFVGRGERRTDWRLPPATVYF